MTATPPRLAAWGQQLLRSDGDPTPPERLDVAPAATSLAGAAVVWATLSLFSLMAVLASGFVNLSLVGLGLLGVLGVIAVAVGSPAARHLTLLGLFAAIAYRMGGFGPHPFPLVGALVAYGVVVMATPSLRGSVGWLHSGSWESSVRRLVAAATAAAVVGLVAWRLLAAPDLTGFQNGFADVPVWTLPAVGLFFAAVKAAAEEVAFRGVVIDALRSSGGVWTALVVQAAVFGFLHYIHGVPSGVAGAALSGVYGLILGVVRLRARGLLAPWVAHVLIDLAVFGVFVGWR